jgi:hypothetical protein
VKHVSVALVVAAVIVLLGASAAGAFVIRPGCPSGWHPGRTSWCVTDATHVAPSSGVVIPDEAMPEPSRTRLRIEIAAGGVLVAGILLWFGLVEVKSERTKETESGALP